MEALRRRQEKEMSKIYQLLLKVASLGHADAQFDLGCIHEDAMKSDTDAFRWYEEAAQQGHAKAQ